MKKKKESVLVVCDYAWQVKTVFDSLVNLMEVDIEKVYPSHCKIVTKNFYIEIKAFNLDTLRGMRVDSVVNLSGANTKYIETIVKNK